MSKPVYLGLIKPFFDRLFALLALVILAPVMGILYLMVRISLGNPALFSQQRPGRLGSSFTLLKFRTMSNARDGHGQLLPDADRLSAFGLFLRSTSLDELPSLFNILRGELSFVGPRPLLSEYLPLYSDRQGRRHELHPGLTGWAQVNGRNQTSWIDRFEMDVWYVDNAAFVLDLRILWRTIARVLKREGISADGESTMPPFTGNPNG